MCEGVNGEGWWGSFASVGAASGERGPRCGAGFGRVWRFGVRELASVFGLFGLLGVFDLLGLLGLLGV